MIGRFWNNPKLQQKAGPTSSLPLSRAVAPVPIIEKIDPRQKPTKFPSPLEPSMADQSRLDPNPIKPDHFTTIKHSTIRANGRKIGRRKGKTPNITTPSSTMTSSTPTTTSSGNVQQQYHQFNNVINIIKNSTTPSGNVGEFWWKQTGLGVIWGQHSGVTQLYNSLELNSYLWVEVSQVQTPFNFKLCC